MGDVTEYFGTENVGGNSAKTMEERLGRCYELTGYALALGKAPRDAILVHGTMHGIRAAHRINHAWLLLDTTRRIWEPAQGHFWPIDLWNIIARPKIEQQYTLSQLHKKLVEFGNWGPWPTA